MKLAEAFWDQSYEIYIKSSIEKIMHVVSMKDKSVFFMDNRCQHF